MEDFDLSMESIMIVNVFCPETFLPGNIFAQPRGSPEIPIVNSVVVLALQMTGPHAGLGICRCAIVDAFLDVPP